MGMTTSALNDDGRKPAASHDEFARREAILLAIEQAVLETAKSLREDAGWAHNHIERFEYFADGYNFGMFGKTEKYKHIVQEMEREADPEYAKYLALKEKFEK